MLTGPGYDSAPAVSHYVDAVLLLLCSFRYVLRHIIKSVDPKSTINEHFGVLPTGISHPSSDDFSKVSRLGFHKGTASCEAPFNVTVDGYSAERYSF